MLNLGRRHLDFEEVNAIPPGSGTISLRTCCAGLPRRFAAGLLASLAVALILIPAPAVRAGEPVRVGVVSFRSTTQNPEHWQPLAEALSQAVPGHDFQVDVLTLAEMEQAVADRRLEFVLTNPGQHVALAQRYGLGAPLATRAEEIAGKRVSSFGGVILALAERRNIKGLADLRGLRIATVDPKAFAGFQIQAYELSRAGLSPMQDFDLVVTGLPMERTVEAVLSGQADAAFVRSGLIEAMAAEGRLDLARVQVVNAQDFKDYPAAVSTRLYPEWAFSAMPHVGEDLARQVAATLFRLQEDHPATRAMGIRGFSVPADYSPVHEVLRELRLPPFDQAPQFTLHDVWSRYRVALIAFLVGLGVILALLARVTLSSRLVARKQGELRESEERFRHLFEDTRQPVMLIEDGRFVAANRASLALLGVESAEWLLGRSPTDISPEFQPDGQNSAAKAEALIARAFAEGSIDFEWEHRRVNGEPFTAQVMLTAMRQAGHDLLHVVWNDITQQKRYERELGRHQENLERLVAERTTELAATSASLKQANREQKALFEAVPVGIAYSRGDTVVAVNPAFTELFGYDLSDFGTIAQWLLLAYPDPDYRQSVSRAWSESMTEAARQDGRIESREYRVTRRDGSVITALIGGRLFDEGMVATFVDITPLKHAEEAERLAREAAEAASQAKADFLANMSHEIRTPLNAIIGMTHLALKAEPSPRLRDYLVKIRGSGAHLLGVINDILDFSKIEAGKLVIEHSDLDLETVLEMVVSQVVDRANAKGLELLLRIDEQLPRKLVGDALRISQILINYATNAVKFTERGEVVIEVTQESRSGDDLLVRFAVRDTGIGIDEAGCKQLFQSFHQADNSISRKYGGTGLGLVISRRLVDLMGGQAGFESTLGVGSNFWFTLRLRASTSQQPLLPRLDLRGRHVLLVEDNEFARNVIGEMLCSMSFVVSGAASGEEALELIRDASSAGNRFDVVLLDWLMPGMDGIETAKAIRALALPKQPLLIIVTAHDREALLEQATAAGIQEVLSKPLTPSSLFNGMMQAFGTTLVAPAARVAPAIPLGTGTNLEGVRVLLVEDNELNQQVAQEFLKGAGMDVDIAADGVLALDAVQKHRYDAVLMDMQMPVMDGLSATRAIRAIPGLQQLPILAMTANAMADDREQCLAAGMNDHIAKPIDPDLLIAKLRAWVRKEGMSASQLTQSASTGTPAEERMGFPAIPGLDIAIGIRQAAGRESLYRSLLGKFVQTQASVPGDIRRALDQNDWKVAERLAHTLKGTVAQIGGGTVRGQAEALESAIRRQDPPTAIEALRAALAEHLEILIAAISAAIVEPPPAPVSAGVFDAGLLSTACSDLARRLNEDDYSSLQVFKDNEALLRAALGEAAGPLGEAIEAFDYTTALMWLREASREHGIDL